MSLVAWGCVALAAVLVALACLPLAFEVFEVLWLFLGRPPKRQPTRRERKFGRYTTQAEAHYRERGWK